MFLLESLCGSMERKMLHIKDRCDQKCKQSQVADLKNALRNKCGCGWSLKAPMGSFGPRDFGSRR